MVLDIDKHVREVKGSEEKCLHVEALFGRWHRDTMRKVSPKGNQQPGFPR